MKPKRNIIETIEENDIELIIYSVFKLLGNIYGYSLSCKACIIKTESVFTSFDEAKRYGLIALNKAKDN